MSVAITSCHAGVFAESPCPAVSCEFDPHHRIKNNRTASCRSCYTVCSLESPLSALLRPVTTLPHSTAIFDPVSLCLCRPPSCLEPLALRLMKPITGSWPCRPAPLPPPSDLPDLLVTDRIWTTTSHHQLTFAAGEESSSPVQPAQASPPLVTELTIPTLSELLSVADQAIVPCHDRRSLSTATVVDLPKLRLSPLRFFICFFFFFSSSCENFGCRRRECVRNKERE